MLVGEQIAEAAFVCPPKKEPTGSSNEEQRRQHCIRALIGYGQFVGGYFIV